MSDDLDKKMQMEQMGMLPGRFYLVLEPLPDANNETEGESGFTLRIYSTAYSDNESEISDNVESTYVVVQGLIGQLEDQFDSIFAKGIERVTLEHLPYTVPEDAIDENTREKIQSISENIIEVDFGGGMVH